MRKAVFEGLIQDENEQPVSVTYVGSDPCYVIDDDGFLRHIDAGQVDREVIRHLAEAIRGNEELLANMTAKHLGQEDIFSKALIETQIRNADTYLESLLNVGLPEEARAYLGMMGFRVRINLHGEVLSVEQPGAIAPEDE